VSKFASDTVVPAEKSRQEIERTLAKYGATSFFYASEPGRAVIGFRASGRIVRMNLPIPNPEDFKLKPNSRWQERTAAQKQAAYDQAVRTKWRCLALAVKAKLEVVESGIATFEQEFLAHVMTPDGRTVGECILPRLEEAYQSGKHVPLLLGPNVPEQTRAP
jgi:hypothetical protein